MPFVRAKNGKKHPVSTAKIAHSVTEAYRTVFEKNVADHRAAIMAHVTTIYQAMCVDFGEEAAQEWPLSALIAHTMTCLKESAPEEVWYAYCLAHDTAPQGQRTSHASRSDPSWNRFEAKKMMCDPEWNIRWPPRQTSSGPTEPSKEGVLSTLGASLRDRMTRPTGEANASLTQRLLCSEWQSWWESVLHDNGLEESQQAFKDAWRTLDTAMHTRSSEEWWSFWVTWVRQELVTRDARTHVLLHWLQWRKSMSEALGGNWLFGTPFLPEMPLWSAAHYRTSALAHFTHLASKGIGTGSTHLTDLASWVHLLKPENDQALSWAGWHWWQTNGCLWSLESRYGWEMPQWALLRAAWSLASQDASGKTLLPDLYQAFTSRQLIPSDALLREAGRPSPRWLEDHAYRIHDTFDAIQEGVHAAAVGTKWTGTVTLDWRAVRSKGALVAGCRISPGVPGFVRAIDMALEAQGRTGADRPVTSLLPLWHADSVEFMALQSTHASHMQIALVVPDVFFDVLRRDGYWVLLDPGVFADLAHPVQGRQILHDVLELAKKHIKGEGWRRVQAHTLWRKLLRVCRAGHACLVFEESSHAWTPFPVSAPPVAGLDGVGAFPIPWHSLSAEQHVSWPTITLNLAAICDAEGLLDQTRLHAIQKIGLRALDNMISQDGTEDAWATKAFRSVCLGVVGTYETMDAVSLGHQDSALVAAWMEGLGKTWHAGLQDADASLVKERGISSFWHTNAAQDLQVSACMERLAENRKGIGRKAPLQNTSSVSPQRRCSVHTIWAPFQGAARVANVTPGGFGTLYPYHEVTTHAGEKEWVPSPFLDHWMRIDPSLATVAGKALRTPQAPGAWSPRIRELLTPSPQEWEQRLQHASLLRPWVDQGISLTLPLGLDEPTLSHLLQRAWWYGITAVRFLSGPSEGVAPHSATTGVPAEGDSEDAGET